MICNAATASDADDVKSTDTNDDNFIGTNILL